MTTTIYFYGQKNSYGYFSKLHRTMDTDICHKTITVHSSEQAIMWMKAVLMNDTTTALQIETN